LEKTKTMPKPTAPANNPMLRIKKLDLLNSQIKILLRQLSTLKNERRIIKQQLGRLANKELLTGKAVNELIKQYTCVMCKSTDRVKLTRNGPKCLSCRRAENLSTEI
jgi:hypothetical protein